MAVVRCPQGHYYDNQSFSSCPHCGISVCADGKDAGKPSEAPKARGSLFGWLERDKTVAMSSGAKEEAASDRTVALEALPDSGDEDQKTVGYYSVVKGNDYVTGWLVCVEGPEKGRDYRLHHGFNRVGRDVEMDVQVMDDPAITRKTHCSIVYDDRKNQFSLVPSAGALTYYQDSLLTKAKMLQAGDQIQMGGSTFEFIPFCRKGRIWEKEEEV
ncbi:MAG: FHA domain-containing protein [Lachnospiraceae bacterium]|nr:FHA domain-containing protein [Lachnospiraceae bacterium]